MPGLTQKTVQKLYEHNYKIKPERTYTIGKLVEKFNIRNEALHKIFGEGSGGHITEFEGDYILKTVNETLRKYRDEHPIKFREIESIG